MFMMLGPGTSRFRDIGITEKRRDQGVANGLLKILALGKKKVSSDLEISEAFVLSLGIPFVCMYFFTPTWWTLP